MPSSRGLLTLCAPGILTFALSHAVDRVIRGDAVHPRPEIRVARKLLELLVRAQERLLHNFFGVVGIAGHPVGQLVDAPAVPLDEDTIGFPLASQRALDGGRVADALSPGWFAAHCHSHD